MFKSQHIRLFAVSILCGAMLLCGAPIAGAQGLSRIVVDIPFDFIVNGKTLPAGRYAVQKALPNAGTALYIGDVGNNDLGTSFMTNSAVALEAPNRAELIFHHYGSTYFLSEVWTGTNTIGYRLPRSRAERIAARGDRSDDSRGGTARTAHGTEDTVIGATSK